MTDESLEDIQVYCSLCGACGESGCCSPSLCKGEGGLYCDLYNPKRGFYELYPFVDYLHRKQWQKRIFVIGLDIRLNVVFEQDNGVINKISRSDLENFYQYQSNTKGWQ